MKRCPKCNRSFPDDNQKFCTIDGGLLLSAEQAFDPNATIAISSLRPPQPPVAQPPPPQPPPVQSPPALSPLPPPPVQPPLPPPPVQPPPPLPREPAGEMLDPNATIAGPRVTPPKKTESTSARATAETLMDKPTTALPPRSQSARATAETLADKPATALPPRTQSAPVRGGPVTQPQPKKSKLPLILGILLLLLVLCVAALVALFFLVIKPRLIAMQENRPVITRKSVNQNANDNVNTNAANTNTNSPATEPEFVPPPNAVKFTNSQANLDERLAEHYVDFSFYYPQTWEIDPKAGITGASNFAKVERRIPPDFTQENFAVGWYTSKGTVEADGPTFPHLVELLGSSLAKGFPEYRKVSEGPTKINSLDGYEFRFVSISKGTEKGDIELWGRVVFLPTGVSGDKTGATLIMLATSLAPELTSVDDVGAKGEMPLILDSFRFGKGR